MGQTYRIELPDLYPEQARIKSEAARFNVAECGRQFGKSTLGTELVSEPALQGKPTAWFSPTYKMLSEPWRNIRALLLPVTAKINEQEHRIELVTGGSIDFWSLEDGCRSVRGRRYARVVIDESAHAPKMQEAWEQSIRPTLTFYIGDAFFLSTPYGRNYFHQLHTKAMDGEKDWKAWRFGSVCNPYLSPEEIAAAKRELPAQVFRQEYEGIPADDAGNPFGIEAIHACIAQMSNLPAVCGGRDLAKSVDWNVGIQLDRNGTVCGFDRFQMPWKEGIRRILSFHGNTRTLVDSTGVGDPIVEELQRESPGNFEGYQFTASSKQRLMEGLAMAIQQQRVHYPPGSLECPIVFELESFRYEYTRTGVRYSAPEGMHDDCVCALALAVQLYIGEGVNQPFRYDRVVRTDIEARGEFGRCIMVE